MQQFLVAVFLVTISGLLQETNGCDTRINKTANFSEDVDLPCNCSISSNFSKWQKDQNKTVFKFFEKQIRLKDYENRVEHIPSETDGYCSIRLKNITEADNGTYECSFENSVYQRHCVNLEVKQKPSAGMMSDSKNPTKPTEPPKPDRKYLSVFPVFVLLLVVGALGNAYFKQRRETNQRMTSLPPEEGVQYSCHIACVDDRHLPRINIQVK